MKDKGDTIVQWINLHQSEQLLSDTVITVSCEIKLKHAPSMIETVRLVDERSISKFKLYCFILVYFVGYKVSQKDEEIGFCCFCHLVFINL